jgi:ribonuclease BN (tRNA processing enzyme)
VTFVTSDTQFRPEQLKDCYQRADQIFHDCDTRSTKSQAHAHYSELKTLPTATKAKMWLYHYFTQVPSVKQDGFMGFCEKDQTFDL